MGHESQLSAEGVIDKKEPSRMIRETEVSAAERAFLSGSNASLLARAPSWPKTTEGLPSSIDQ
jgi:hypothetical protein